jgi:DNA-binding LacI/PurR family transcriptional regulator
VVSSMEQVLASALPLAGLAVITTHEDEDDLERALRLGVPVISDAFVADPRAAGWVELDYAGSAALVMDHFVEQGAQRPGLLWGVYGDKLLGRVHDAYVEWCTHTGHEVLEFCTDPSNELLDKGVDDLLERGVDAIYTVVESVPRIIRAIEQRGLTVGKDVCLVTLDEDVSGYLSEIGVSTVDLTGGAYAESIVGALIDAVEGKTSGHVVINGALTLTPRRSSTCT